MKDEQIKIWWTTRIHLVDPNKKQIDKLVDKYDLHEIIEQDFLDFTTQDKIDTYDDCLFLVMRFPKFNTRTKKHFANQINEAITAIAKDFHTTVDQVNQWSSYQGGGTKRFSVEIACTNTEANDVRNRNWQNVPSIRNAADALGEIARRF